MSRHGYASSDDGEQYVHPLATFGQSTMCSGFVTGHAAIVCALCGRPSSSPVSCECCSASPETPAGGPWSHRCSPSWLWTLSGQDSPVLSREGCRRLRFWVMPALKEGDEASSDGDGSDEAVRGHDEIVPRTKEPTAFKWPFGAIFGLLSRTFGTIRHTTVKTRLEKA